MEFLQGIFTSELWEKAMSSANAVIIVLLLLAAPIALPDDDSKRRILIVPISIFIGWYAMLFASDFSEGLVFSMSVMFLTMFLVAIILDKSRFMNVLAAPVSRFSAYLLKLMGKIGPYGGLIILALLAIPLIIFWQTMFK